MDNDPLRWYLSVPIVTRLYLTAAVAITGCCFMEWISPLTLYYNYDLIFRRGQYWRLISSFLFFGSFSLDFMFHLYFVVGFFFVCSFPCRLRRLLFRLLSSLNVLLFPLTEITVAILSATGGREI